MPCDLSHRVFAEWQAIFASRIGRPQMDAAQRADYLAFCRVFDDDDDFTRAAQRVYERWASWDAWPAPIEFESARATLRRVPDAEIKATLRTIDESRRLAPPPGAFDGERAASLDAFGAAWRTQLAHCSPEACEQARRDAVQGGTGVDPWLTDERHDAVFPPETLASQIDADADRDAA
jgi:hypothetical protein